jgi:hypothetical protein
VFGWLVQLDCLNTRANLLHKNIIDDKIVSICSSHALPHKVCNKPEYISPSAASTTCGPSLRKPPYLHDLAIHCAALSLENLGC